MTAAAPQEPTRRLISVVDVSHGLYLNVAPSKVPPGALVAGSKNIRVYKGSLTNERVGYSQFPNASTPVVLNGYPKLLTAFKASTGAVTPVMGTPTDLYYYDEGAAQVYFLTPFYDTGTVDSVSPFTTVTGVGTAWNSTVKVGDQFAAGAAGETDPNAAWVTVIAVVSDVNITVDAPVGALSGSDYTIRQVFELEDEDLWQDELFLAAGSPATDTLYMTYGQEINIGSFPATSQGGFVKWDGSSTTVEYVDLGFTAKYMKQHKRMMLYGSLSYSGSNLPQSMRNSDIDFPEVADGTSGLSREVRISNTTDVPMGFKPIGDGIAAYFDRSVNLIQFVGEPIVWAIRTVIPTFGLIAPGLIQDRGNVHEFMSADRAYQFNGVSIQEFGEQVFRQVLMTEDESRLHLGVSYTDEEFGEVLWSIPLRTDVPNGIGDSATRTYVTHYREQQPERLMPITVRTMPATAYMRYEKGGTAHWEDFLGTNFDEVSRSWDDKFFATGAAIDLVSLQDGSIQILNGATARAGAALESIAVFGTAPLWDGEYVGVARRFYPFFRVRFGASHTIIAWMRFYRFRNDTAANAIAQEFLTVPLDGSAEVEWLALREAGRYADLSILNFGVEELWALEGFDVLVTRAGQKL